MTAPAKQKSTRAAFIESINDLFVDQWRRRTGRKPCVRFSMDEGDPCSVTYAIEKGQGWIYNIVLLPGELVLNSGISGGQAVLRLDDEALVGRCKVWFECTVRLILSENQQLAQSLGCQNPRKPRS
jgi:hypothetical protein